MARVGRALFVGGQFLAALVGIWGVVCLILALADQAGRVTG